MSFASRILDRLVLKPTRNPIDPEQRRRLSVKTSFGAIEVWIFDHRPPTARQHVVALKFPGAGGRAERAGPHPFDFWPDVSAEIWAVNMPGYGGSEGRASLSAITSVARAVWDAAHRAAGHDRPMVIGNSLGCSAALFLAAHVDVGEVMVRNPVPLRELILGRHSWWNAGLLSEWLVRGVPDELDPIANARLSSVPAYFFQSAEDTLVSPHYQNRVIDAYRGPKKVFIAAGIDHHDLVPEKIQEDYRESLNWLEQQRRR